MGSVFTRPVSGVRPGEGEPRTDAMVDEALTIKIEVGGSSSRLAFPSVDGDSVAGNTHPVVHRNGVARIVEDEAGTQGVFECLLLFALVACVVLYTDKKIDLLSMLLTFVLVALLFGLKHGVSLLRLFCRLFCKQ